MILYEDILKDMRNELPPLLCVLGPSGVGKRTFASNVSKYITLSNYINTIKNPDVADVKSLQKVINTIPTNNNKRVSILEFSKNNDKVFNMLLKILEESADFNRFILVMDFEPLPTILSRGFVLRFGKISSNVIADVLVSDGVRKDLAMKISTMCGGNLTLAKNMIAEQGGRDVMLSIFRSIYTGNLQLLSFLLDKDKVVDDVYPFLDMFIVDLKIYKDLEFNGSFVGFRIEEVRDLFDFFLSDYKLFIEIMTSKASLAMRFFSLACSFGKFQGVQ